MTTKCKVCKYDYICPPIYKEKAEAKPTFCEQYVSDEGIEGNRNWT